MAKGEDRKQHMTPREWAELLRSGDGQGLVPYPIAVEMYNQGFTKREPVAAKRGVHHVLVRLRDGQPRAE